MTRLEALKEAEALVARLMPETPTLSPRDLDRRISGKPVEASVPSLGDRISQILRVADYLMKEGTE